VLALLLSACSSWLHPYRIEVQQGNFLNDAAVAKLQRGMTREQVKFLLGTPLVADAFHPDRWDYVFWRQRAGVGDAEPRRLALFFKDNALDHVAGDVVPSAFGESRDRVSQQ
jgi:outer membrane protein assembly factor BamE